MLMTIKYCDYINGLDTNAGNYNTPCKTITQASIGLTGGDEVRVAKSPEPISLTGTLAFTAGSTTVTGTGTIFTTELVIGDFIIGGDGHWYEVVTRTNDTSVVLYQKYSGVTQSGLSSQKLGVTSTGAASASATTIQAVSASGTSAAQLVISGGWDLSTQSVTWHTFFRQMHSTFANRYGSGLYVARNYTTVSNLGFLRYNYGIYYFTASNNNIAESCTCNSNSSGIYYLTSPLNAAISCICNCNSTGIYYVAGQNNIATSCTCNSNYFYGVYSTVAHNNILTSCVCNYNSWYGFYVSASANNIATSCTFNNNFSCGIYYLNSSNNTVSSCTCNNNTSYGVCSDLSTLTYINNYQSTSNQSTSIVVMAAKTYSEIPAVCVQRYNNTSGNHRCYYEYGVTYRNTADARSGECLEYDPTSLIYYIKQSFYFAANSGVDKTLSAYVKASTVFNGDVSGAIFFMGIAITEWSDITPTGYDAYEQKSLVANAADIIEDGVLELQIKVRGDAGSVYVDDFSAA